MSAQSNASTPVVMAYWPAWGTPPSIPDMDFRLAIAFAWLFPNEEGKWIDYTVSGSFEQPDTLAHKIWSTWLDAHRGSGATALLSCGGDNNTTLRSDILEAKSEILDRLADKLGRELESHGFDGVDFDVEHWWSYKTEQNRTFASNLARIVKRLGKNHSKLITVAVGADAAKDSSFTGSMLPLLTDDEAMAYVDRVNIMFYNLGGIDNLYTDLGNVDKLLDTYDKKLLAKLCIGIQPVQAAGKPPADPDAVKAFCTHLHQRGVGGAFLWVIGDERVLGKHSAAEFIASMKSGFDLRN